MEATQEQKDIADSLRLEANELSPAQDVSLKSLLSEFSVIIQEKFQGFIPPESIQRAANTSYSTLVTKEPVLVRAFWQQQTFDASFLTALDILKISKSNAGAYSNSSKTQLAFVKPQEKMWEDLTQEQKDKEAEVLKTFFPGMNPEQVYSAIMFVRTTAHELGHAFADQSLPHGFDELSAEFMADIVIDTYFPGSFKPSTTQQFFKKLEEKFGSDAYKVIFGTCKNPLTRFRIAHSVNFADSNKILGRA